MPTIYTFTDHAREQMEKRGISEALARRVLCRKAALRWKGALVVERSLVVRHEGRKRRVCVLVDISAKAIITIYWRNGET